jgi:lipid II:glycine glycyltransferase (peptidoglycan interpeptide bridge formation enzyme)
VSGIALVAAGPEDRERWNAFVREHPEGHFFQSWEWGDLQVELGATPLRIIAIDDDRLIGAMLLLLFDTGSRVFSFVPRGPVVDPDDEDLAPRFIEAAIELSLAAGANLVRFEPQWAFTPARAERFTGRGFAVARQHIMPLRTSIVDLRPPLDAVWAGFHSNTRNRVRLAEKRGVTVRAAGLDEVPIFARLFEETNQRHARRLGRVDQVFLAAKHFGARDAMRLFLARADGEDLAGIVVFPFGRTATYLWGASSAAEHARKLNPNQLLHWVAMQWARERGCEEYDLYGIPDFDEATLEAEYATRTDGWWNLYRFKRGFGGRVHRHLGTFDFVPRRAD